MISVIALTLLTIPASVPLFGQNGLKHSTADDVFELEYANSPQISPGKNK